MKMVKSLLLGSAAGVVAVAGAQAADLPVKAKAVEYVKICSLYGAGYYYIPGTDICMKVGGYVRAEAQQNYGGLGSPGQFSNIASGYQSRTDAQDFIWRNRAYATFDTRQQTQYGVLRTYLAVGVNNDGAGANTFNANRAFIQWAGFTMGVATSYYDFYSSPATSYLVPWSSDTGDPGWKVMAYTAQFGGGVSATIAAEDPRRATVVNTGMATPTSTANAFTGALNTVFTNVVLGAPLAIGALGTADMIKVRYPDIVANLRIDQTWGGAQIMGALHDSSGGYYTGATGGNWNGGHPGDKMGFAVGAGLKLNLPMIGPGDYLQAQFNYTQGAVRYVAFTPFGASNAVQFAGNSLGVGYVTDAVFCGAVAGGGATVGCPNGAGSVELTTAWGVNAAYEHFWTPALRTSAVFGYTKVQYNGNASGMIAAALQGNSTGACVNSNNQTSASTANTQIGSGMISNLSNCNSDWSFYTVGSRTQWNVTKDFYLGVDVLYSKLQTAYSGTGIYRTPTGTSAPSGTYTISDQSNWAFRFRAHRDIVP